MANEAPATWDKAAVKWLLKDPLKLQGSPAYWPWILERGGLEAVLRALRALPLPSNTALLLQTILDHPGQTAATYADRLNLSMTTYFRWLDDLVARLVLALNQLPSSLPRPALPREQPAQGEPTLPRQPSTLPLQTSLFIGRQTEILYIRQLLRQPAVRLVTLTGPGGIGKTSLSIEVARELGAAFADGIVFVSLAALRDPNGLGLVLLQALGLQQADARPEQEVLIGHLRERELLLVLDNFEQLLAAAPLVGTLLEAAPRLKLLVTSRSVLRLQGEQTVLVPPLALPEPLPAGATDGASDEALESLAQTEAVRLFVERAHQVSPDFQLTSENAWAVAEICRQLEGVPLAIVLAATRTRVLTPECIAARLHQRLALLTRGPLDLPARQQTLRQTLDWSYELLSAPQQALFRQLAIFAGGCTLEAVCAVCQLDEVQVLDGLAELIDQSMLQSQEQPDGETRFSMLETIREYGEELLARGGKAAALRSRHAQYYLALAETAEPELTSGPRQKHWYDRLLQEHENLRAALSWSLAGPAAEVGLALAAALWKFWQFRGYHTEGRRWLTRAVEHARPLLAELRMAPDSSAALRSLLGMQARSLVGAGWLASDQGDFVSAEACFGESLAVFCELDDQRGIGIALQGVGNATRARGDYERARRYFEESHQILVALGDREETAWVMGHLGLIAHCQGDFDTAEAYHVRALAEFEAMNHRWGIDLQRNHLVETLLDKGASARAKLLIEPWLARQRQEHNQHGVPFALALAYLGEAELNAGNFEQAERAFAECLAISRAEGFALRITQVCAGLGHLAMIRGNNQEARRSFAEGLRVQQQQPEVWQSLRLLEGVAYLAAREGAFAEAAHLYGMVEAVRRASKISHVMRRYNAPAHSREQLRATLGAALFDQIWQTAQSGTLEQALEVALAYLA